jgi:hypothetical protein
MKTMNRAEKESYWRGQLGDAKKFSGSQVEFCRTRGISFHTFQYWRKRLADRACSSATQMSLQPFVAVEVERLRESQTQLPDARWVAEVMTHLIRGF